MVILMELKNTIFAILAVFCVVLSACAVSAADDVTGDFNATDVGDIHDDMILPPDYAHDEAQNQAAGGDVDGEETHNSMILPPDYAHDEANATNATTDAVGNAAGENATSGNATNATSSNTMHATGNPILALLAVGAVLGGAAVITRRKK